MRTMNLAALSTTALAVALVLALPACGGEAPPPAAPPPPPPPPTATASAAPPPADTTPPAPPPKPALADLIPQAIKGVNDAFNAHDAAKLASFATDDVTSLTYGAPGMSETHSRGDMTTGMTAFFTAFPDAKSVATRAWIKDHVAVVEVVWTGTMKGDMGPVKATNKPAGAVTLQVMTFNDDGLVKEMHEYQDDSVVWAQIAGKKGAPPVPVLPTNPTEMHVAKGSPDEDKLAAWGKSVDDAFNKDDAKAVLAVYADDADYWINVGGGPATHGKKDNTKMLTGWFKTLPDQKWTVTNAWGIDGFAIVEHSVAGTAKGAMGPIPASNKAVTGWHWVDVMQSSADGKVQHGWGYANLNEMLAQTGQLKMPGDAGAAKPAKPAGAAPAAPAKKP